MNELSNQVFLQMLKDTVRVVMLLDAIYVIWLVSMAMKWLLNLIWKLATKAGKVAWKLMKKVFNRQEIAITVEQTEV